jgi:hypothetical protein
MAERKMKTTPAVVKASFDPSRPVLSYAHMPDHAKLLEHLRAVDPDCTLFGADTHGYELGEPLSERELSALEARHGARLPAEYRDFLLHVGDGGAGPGYGLAPARDDDTWRFPPLADFAGAPEGPGRAIKLADLGCDIVHFLVVTGPAAGQVWVDPSGGQEIARIADDFDAYYGEWLEASIVERAANAARTQVLTSPNEDPAILAAIPIAERLLARDPSIALHDQTGVLLLYGFKPREAIAILERGGAIDGGLVPTSITLALAHRLQQRHEVAVGIVDRALATKPTYSPYCEALLWEKARNLAALDRMAEAVDAAYEARTDHEYFVMRNQIDFFVMAVQAGQKGRAEAALEEFIEDSSEDDAPPAERRQEVYAIVVQAAEAYGLDDVARDYAERGRRLVE